MRCVRLLAMRSRLRQRLRPGFSWLRAHTVFGPPGPAFRDVPYTAMVRAGGPGTGYVDLEILGMSFKGTVEHGQIQIAT